MPTRRLNELEDEVTQGSNAVWPEIGHLGCRVADLHAVLDERVPPKDGSKVAPPSRSGTQAGPPNSLRSGSRNLLGGQGLIGMLYAAECFLRALLERFLSSTLSSFSIVRTSLNPAGTLFSLYLKNPQQHSVQIH